MLKTLGNLLKTKKEFVLFLGTAASVFCAPLEKNSESHVSIKEIVEDIVEWHELDKKDIWNSFCTYLRNLNPKKRFHILSKYFEDRKPSPGYQALATLIEKGYFRLIFTCSFDSMLEEALKSTRLSPEDYTVMTAVGELSEPDSRIITDSRITIVKLRGDYKSKNLLFSLDQKLLNSITQLTQKTTLFVGFSTLDRDILSLVSKKGGPVFWITPREVYADPFIQDSRPDEYHYNREVKEFLQNRQSISNVIWGKNGRSDTFFEELLEEVSTMDINSFCDTLMLPKEKYRKLRELFEPPHQYEEMKQTLEDQKVLLICGDPHLGKRYTALTILYDYHIKGRRVGFFPECKKELFWESLFDWDQFYTFNGILYFENPFKKQENLETFESNLRKTIRRIQNTNSSVVITSNLDAFKKLDRHEFPVVELTQGSYDLGRRQKIVDNYLRSEKKSPGTVDGVPLNTYLAGELTTPHSIAVFFERFPEKREGTKLIEKVKESKEIFEIFTKEIEEDTAKKIFFYCCYILALKDVELIRKCYEAVMNSLKIPYNFEDLLNNSRVELLGFSTLVLRFSHPEFARAVELSLWRNPDLSGKVLLKLAQEDAPVRKSVAEAVGRIDLPECRNLLMRLSEDEDSSVRQAVAMTVGEHFGGLPEECQRLLLTFAEDENSAVRWSGIASAITCNELPDTYRNLLRVLAQDENPDVRKNVARTVGENFSRLPEYWNLLPELARDEDWGVRDEVATVIGDNFSVLSEEYRKLFFSFVKDRSPLVRCSVSYYLGYNMGILSEEYKRLVMVLARDAEVIVREYIPSLIAANFERLPEECRKLLFVLAEDEEWLIRADVVPPLGKAFEKLPEEYRRLLITLAVDEDEFVREKMAYTIGYNFEKLPDEYRKILFTLVRDKDSSVRGAVARSVGYNFRKMPEEYRRLLILLAQDENCDVRRDVVNIVGKVFGELSEEYRELLFKLARDKDTAGAVARTVSDHFAALTGEYRRILLMLARDEDGHVRGQVAERLGQNFRKLPEEYRKLLVTLSRDEDEYVREKAIETVSNNLERFPPEYQRIFELKMYRKEKRERE